MNAELLTLLQILGPPVAVYAAIRADIATLTERTKTHTAQIKDLYERNNRRQGERL